MNKMFISATSDSIIYVSIYIYNPVLIRCLPKKKYCMRVLLSKPNGVFLMYVPSSKTLVCLIISQKIVIIWEVSQYLPLACQLGSLLALQLAWILHNFYTDGESVRKQCTYLQIKCGCYENWPHSATSSFSWEKSIVLTWQQLLTLWWGWGKYVLQDVQSSWQWTNFAQPRTRKRDTVSPACNSDVFWKIKKGSS